MEAHSTTRSHDHEGGCEPQSAFMTDMKYQLPLQF